jgi:hypothetical protein
MNCPPSEKAAMQGHVRKRRTWEFIVDIGRHPITGKRRQKSKSGFATKKEAESALHEFIRYVEGGGDPCPERMALGAYLGRWLEYQRARGIRSRTLDGYEGYIRREILPSIGGLELGRIRPGHVRALLTRMQRRDSLLPRSPRSGACSARPSARPWKTGSSRRTRSPP